jgi:hypothetical protein
MATSFLDQAPYQDPFEALDDQGRRTGFFSRAWLNYFERQRTRVTESPQRVKRLTLSVIAAVGTTPFLVGELAAGMYRVSWNARIKTPAGISSSLQITIGYLDGTVAQTFLGDLLNTNTTTTKESQSKVLRIDKGAITYALAYASNPAAAMVADLDFVIESLNG